jgi:hypothetical protein
VRGAERMDAETLRKACEEFKNEEGRASYYDVALEIVEDHPLHASLIILAVWNMNRFRFMANDTQNLVYLKSVMEECKPLFEQLKEKNFKTVNFDEIRDTVELIYSKFSQINGVEYTGTSKVMHLLNRKLFVMWDRDIREEYGFNEADGNDYFNFLKLMQEKFKDIEWDMASKTFPKAIDEFNHVTITLPKMRERYGKKKCLE